MRPAPKISFLLCTRNRSLTAQECVEKLLTTERKDIEVIVRDNHSTDDTFDVLKKIKDDRFKIVQSRENQGTRNFFEIVKYANGEIITWLSDEDDFEFSNLDYILDRFQETKCQVMIGGIVVGKANAKILFPEGVETDLVRAYQLVLGFSGCGGVFVRRSATEKILKLKVDDEDSAYSFWNYYPVGFFATRALGSGPLCTTSRIMIKQARHAKTNNNWCTKNKKRRKLPHYYPRSIYSRMISSVSYLVQANIPFGTKRAIVSSLLIGFYTNSKYYKHEALISLLKDNYEQKIIDDYVAHIDSLMLDKASVRLFYNLALTILLPFRVVTKLLYWRKRKEVT